MTARFQVDLVPVRGGTLRSGGTLDEVKRAWRAHADLGLPWHYFSKETGSITIEIPDLLVQRCPMTWGELKLLNPDIVRDLKDADESRDHPVARLLWQAASEAAAFAATASGLPLRLPTEWEWEYVARGRDDRKYPWGDEFSTSCANFAETGVGHSEPVGSRPSGASVDGVLDLAGNVDEWTSSIYEPLPGAHWTVPETETWAADPHVTRGGSWEHNRDLARCRRRHGLYRPWIGAGFRLVMEDPMRGQG